LTINLGEFETLGHPKGSLLSTHFLVTQRLLKEAVPSALLLVLNSDLFKLPIQIVNFRLKLQYIKFQILILFYKLLYIGRKLILSFRYLLNFFIFFLDLTFQIQIRFIELIQTVTEFLLDFTDNLFVLLYRPLNCLINHLFLKLCRNVRLL